MSLESTLRDTKKVNKYFPATKQFFRFLIHGCAQKITSIKSEHLDYIFIVVTGKRKLNIFQIQKSNSAVVYKGQAKTQKKREKNYSGPSTGMQTTRMTCILFNFPLLLGPIEVPSIFSNLIVHLLRALLLRPSF